MFRTGAWRSDARGAQAASHPKRKRSPVRDLSLCRAAGACVVEERLMERGARRADFLLRLRHAHAPDACDEPAAYDDDSDSASETVRSLSRKPRKRGREAGRNKARAEDAYEDDDSCEEEEAATDDDDANEEAAWRAKDAPKKGGNYLAYNRWLKTSSVNVGGAKERPCRVPLVERVVARGGDIEGAPPAARRKGRAMLFDSAQRRLQGFGMPAPEIMRMLERPTVERQTRPIVLRMPPHNGPFLGKSMRWNPGGRLSSASPSYSSFASRSRTRSPSPPPLPSAPSPSALSSSASPPCPSSSVSTRPRQPNASFTHEHPPLGNDTSPDGVHADDAHDDGRHGGDGQAKQLATEARTEKSDVEEDADDGAGRGTRTADSPAKVEQQGIRKKKARKRASRKRAPEATQCDRADVDDGAMAAAEPDSGRAEPTDQAAKGGDDDGDGLANAAKRRPKRRGGGGGVESISPVTPDDLFSTPILAHVGLLPRAILAAQRQAIAQLMHNPDATLAPLSTLPGAATATAAPPSPSSLSSVSTGSFVSSSAGGSPLLGNEEEEDDDEGAVLVRGPRTRAEDVENGLNLDDVVDESYAWLSLLLEDGYNGQGNEAPSSAKGVSAPRPEDDDHDGGSSAGEGRGQAAASPRCRAPSPEDNHQDAGSSAEEDDGGWEECASSWD